MHIVDCLADDNILLVVPGSQAGVGRLSWTVAESFRAFVERVNANFRDKNVVFYNRAETDNLWMSKDYYESRMSLRKQDDFN